MDDVASRKKLRRADGVVQHVDERHKSNDAVRRQLRVVKERLAVAMPALHLRARPIVDHSAPALHSVAEDALHEGHPDCIVE